MTTRIALAAAAGLAASANAQFLFSENDPSAFGDEAVLSGGATIPSGASFFESDQTGTFANVIANFGEGSFGANVNALHGVNPNFTLFVLSADVDLDGDGVLEDVGDQKILSFDGSTVREVFDFTPLFDGGFSIDALSFDGDGNIYFSTEFSETFLGNSITDGDVWKYNPITGEATEFLDEDVFFDEFSDDTEVDAFQYVSDSEFYLSVGPSDGGGFASDAFSGDIFVQPDDVTLVTEFDGTGGVLDEFVNGSSSSFSSDVPQFFDAFGENIIGFSFIPAPGAVAAFAMTGLAAARRRRA